MTHRKQIRKEHEGQPIQFSAYDGKTYFGHVIEVRKRGIQITYYVPQVMRECQASVLNENLARVSVL